MDAIFMLTMCQRWWHEPMIMTNLYNFVIHKIQFTSIVVAPFLIAVFGCLPPEFQHGHSSEHTHTPIPHLHHPFPKSYLVKSSARAGGSPSTPGIQIEWKTFWLSYWFHTQHSRNTDDHFNVYLFVVLLWNKDCILPQLSRGDWTWQQRVSHLDNGTKMLQKHFLFHNFFHLA